jgi:hypothetical protein
LFQSTPHHTTKRGSRVESLSEDINFSCSLFLAPAAKQATGDQSTFSSDEKWQFVRHPAQEITQKLKFD